MQTEIEFISYRKELAAEFRRLNLAWLEKYFYVEPADQEILSDPDHNILDKGGSVFFAMDGEVVVGTCALLPKEVGVFELGKMAVDEKYQGKGIGHLLLQGTIHAARQMGAQKVILFSNTILEPALHLYRKFGFREIPIVHSEYKRSNIQMELVLSPLVVDDVALPHAESKRMKNLFAKKSSGVLNIYCTAGYPQLDSTLEVMKSLQEAGADLIELGMPYSDPLADGPVIQQSSAQALENGMTISKLFGQLQGFRKEIHIPVVLMGYLNPVLQYGFEKFCATASVCGIDGLIIPDIPVHVYEKEYRDMVHRYGLDFIFLVTPETTDERIRHLDGASSGFLYAVSSSSITGSEKNFGSVEAFGERLKSLQLRNPVLIGFGIKDRETFLKACAHAQGAIIGTAYIRALGSGKNIGKQTKAFVESIIETGK